MDAAEAQRLQTSGSFTGLGLTEEDATRKDSLMDILQIEGETMGIKLLRRMGWRDGQGVGPKVRRNARLGGDGEDEHTHLFAPENSRLISFARKDDHMGLGYESEARLRAEVGSARSGQRDEGEDEDIGFGSNSKDAKQKKKKITKKTGIGVGILNDTGSDDEDPYDIGPRVMYSKVIGGSNKKKTKPSEIGRLKSTASNPLLGSNPVFISKKASSLAARPGFRRCQDGRLPLDGFVLSTVDDGMVSVDTQGKTYPPPQIPEGWKSSKQPTSSGKSASYQSAADAARASSLNPASRASMLGEVQLPGKSVFDFISPAARERIAVTSGHKNLPLGLGESAPSGFSVSKEEKEKDLRDLVPDLNKDVAIKALGRGIGGWTPYAEDETKRARYRAFLESKAGLRTGLPDLPLGLSKEDWINELREFAHAAQLFKPMTGMMASRFTSSTAQAQPAPNTAESESPSSDPTDNLLREASKKPEDAAEAAAKVGMYGPMTRSIHQFYPTRLLCKRFNVKPPSHVQPDLESAAGHANATATPGNSTGPSQSGASKPSSLTLPTKSLDLVSNAAVNDILRESKGQATLSVPAQIKEAVVHVDQNQALEAKRPGEAVFKAIFGSDDEDDNES